MFAVIECYNLVFSFNPGPYIIVHTKYIDLVHKVS